MSFHYEIDPAELDIRPEQSVAEILRRTPVRRIERVVNDRESGITVEHLIQNVVAKKLVQLEKELADNAHSDIHEEVGELPAKTPDFVNPTYRISTLPKNIFSPAVLSAVKHSPAHFDQFIQYNQDQEELEDHRTNKQLCVIDDPWKLKNGISTIPSICDALPYTLIGNIADLFLARFLILRWRLESASTCFTESESEEEINRARAATVEVINQNLSKDYLVPYVTGLKTERCALYSRLAPIFEIAKTHFSKNSESRINIYHFIDRLQQCVTTTGLFSLAKTEDQKINESEHARTFLCPRFLCDLSTYSHWAGSNHFLPIFHNPFSSILTVYSRLYKQLFRTAPPDIKKVTFFMPALEDRPGNTARGLHVYFQFDRIESNNQYKGAPATPYALKHRYKVADVHLRATGDSMFSTTIPFFNVFSDSRICVGDTEQIATCVSSGIYGPKDIASAQLKVLEIMRANRDLYGHGAKQFSHFAFTPSKHNANILLPTALNPIAVYSICQPRTINLINVLTRDIKIEEGLSGIYLEMANQVALSLRPSFRQLTPEQYLEKIKLLDFPRPQSGQINTRLFIDYMFGRLYNDEAPAFSLEEAYSILSCGFSNISQDNKEITASSLFHKIYEPHNRGTSHAISYFYAKNKLPASYMHGSGGTKEQKTSHFPFILYLNELTLKKPVEDILRNPLSLYLLITELQDLEKYSDSLFYGAIYSQSRTTTRFLRSSIVNQPPVLRAYLTNIYLAIEEHVTPDMTEILSPFGDLSDAIFRDEGERIPKANVLIEPLLLEQADQYYPEHDYSRRGRKYRNSFIELLLQCSRHRKKDIRGVFCSLMQGGQYIFSNTNDKRIRGILGLRQSTDLNGVSVPAHQAGIVKPSNLRYILTTDHARPYIKTRTQYLIRLINHYLEARRAASFIENIRKTPPEQRFFYEESAALNLIRISTLLKSSESGNLWVKKTTGTPQRDLLLGYGSANNVREGIYIATAMLSVLNTKAVQTIEDYFRVYSSLPCNNVPPEAAAFYEINSAILSFFSLEKSDLLPEIFNHISNISVKYMSLIKNSSPRGLRYEKIRQLFLKISAAEEQRVQNQGPTVGALQEIASAAHNAIKSLNSEQVIYGQSASSGSFISYFSIILSPSAEALRHIFPEDITRINQLTSALDTLTEPEPELEPIYAEEEEPEEDPADYEEPDFDDD